MKFKVHFQEMDICLFRFRRISKFVCTRVCNLQKKSRCGISSSFHHSISLISSFISSSSFLPFLPLSTSLLILFQFVLHRCTDCYVHHLLTTQSFNTHLHATILHINAIAQIYLITAPSLSIPSKPSKISLPPSKPSPPLVAFILLVQTS